MDKIFIMFAVALLKHWLPQITDKAAVKRALLDVRDAISQLYPGE